MYACARSTVIAGYQRRLIALRGLVHQLREALQQPHDVLRLGIGQSCVVGLRIDMRLAQHRAAPRIGVLHIRPGLAVEVERAVPPEVDVLYAARAQCKEHHRAYADLAGDLVLVFELRALFIDYLARLFNRAVEQILQIEYAAMGGCSAPDLRTISCRTPRAPDPSPSRSPSALSP